MSNDAFSYTPYQQMFKSCQTMRRSYDEIDLMLFGKVANRRGRQSDMDNAIDLDPTNFRQSQELLHLHLSAFPRRL